MTPKTSGFTRPAARVLAAAVAVVAAALLSTASATTYHARSPEQLAAAAHMIFVGTVESSSTSLIDGQPWTEVTFDVDAWVVQDRAPVASLEQGSAQQLPTTVALSFLGGWVAGAPGLTVSGVPQLAQRQRVLVFAYDTPGLASPVAGVNQGLWTVETRGARSATGLYLEVTDQGRLTEGATGSTIDQLVQTLAELLASGNFEPQQPTEPQSQPPESEPDSQEAQGNPQPGAEAPPATATQRPALQPQGPRARAIWYAVNAAGGPLVLEESVATAARVWQEASAGGVHFIEATDDPEASDVAHTVLYGSPQLFGPDALSFTLVYEGQPTQVLISPQAAAHLQAVLVHELGVLIGLPEGGTGVMAHAVTTNQAPLPADLLALQQLLTFMPEDLNRDGTVDFYDLSLLAQAFGSRGINLPADLNSDGVVDDADLELLKAAYTFMPPSENPPSQP